jgi:DNA-directed RNA polymerase subunit K/omega
MARPSKNQANKKKGNVASKPRGRPKTKGGAVAKSDEDIMNSDYSDYDDDSVGDFETIDELSDGVIVEDIDDDIDLGEEEFDYDNEFGSDSDGDNECNNMYNAVNKRKQLDIDDIDDDDDDIDDIEGITIVDNDRIIAERTAHEYITKYEYTRLISERGTQISQGAKPLVLNARGLKPQTIAQLEFEAKVIPNIISRPFADGKEIWPVTDLKYKKHMIKFGEDAFKGDYKQRGGSTDTSNISYPTINMDYVKQKVLEIERGGNTMGVARVVPYISNESVRLV